MTRARAASSSRRSRCRRCPASRSPPTPSISRRNRRSATSGSPTRPTRSSIAPATANVIAQARARHRRRSAHHGAARDARAGAGRAGDERAHVGEPHRAGEPASAARRAACASSSPASGSLACGYEGAGAPGRAGDVCRGDQGARSRRRPRAASACWSPPGPTREPIDPVRFISNRSSGKMGYALARRARRRGAEVALVTGPTALAAPPGVEHVPVDHGRRDARGGAASRDAAGDRWSSWRRRSPTTAPRRAGARKLKKAGRAAARSSSSAPPTSSRELGARKGRIALLVGFAAETEHGHRATPSASCATSSSI